VSGASSPASRPIKKVQQLASHADLYQDVSHSPAPPLRSRRGHLDAIIVPASRPASFLQPAIELSAFLGAFLIVLCSKQTKVDQVARRVARTPGARALIAQIPLGWEHPEFPSRTSDTKFRKVSAKRNSDLSAKRNLGLLLARFHGLNKIAFVDDDVTLSQTDNIARLAGQLDEHQVAGMVVRRHPDNSVVCHARRLAGMAQDVFVTGAVLGVHCNSLPLSFFPDIYNEDWFFFAKDAAARKLPRVGNARQADYDPFASPDRARCEEFGDLLAEGLYALIGEQDPKVPFDDQLRGATRAYWLRFIEARHEAINETKTKLTGFVNRDGDSGQMFSALASLVAAEDQLGSITADFCTDFLEAWRDDVSDWEKFSNRVNNVISTRTAMDFLRLKTWTRTEFGSVAIDSETAPVDLTNPVTV
jgi:glycosyltransferase involved in cell wall biosynthesis